MTFTDSQYFTKLSCNIIQAIVPTKTSKQRDKFGDCCLIIVLVTNFDSLFDSGGICAKLRVVCGSVLRVNLGRKRMATWVEDSRSTVLSCELLEQLDLGLPLPEDSCMAVALEIRLRTKTDIIVAKALKQLKDDCTQLKLSDPSSFWFSFELSAVASRSDLLFRQFNMEHKGHNIAG